MKKKVTMSVWLERMLLLVVAFIMGEVWEVGILYGSYQLLRSQAGGLEIKRRYVRAFAMLMILKAGKLSKALICPCWLLVLLLALINSIIYLFAPATNQEKEDWGEEERRLAKNKAVFVTGGLSICVLIMGRSPLAAMVLLALLCETAMVMGVIVSAILTQEYKNT